MPTEVLLVCRTPVCCKPGSMASLLKSAHPWDLLSRRNKIVNSAHQGSSLGDSAKHPRMLANAFWVLFCAQHHSEQHRSGNSLSPHINLGGGTTVSPASQTGK